jgi:hypothetical protein
VERIVSRVVAALIPEVKKAIDAAFEERAKAEEKKAILRLASEVFPEEMARLLGKKGDQ